MSYDELIVLREELNELADQVQNCLVKLEVLKIKFDKILSLKN